MKKLRVAAYVRTDEEEIPQAVSRELLRESAACRIKDHQGWDYAGVYMDECDRSVALLDRLGFGMLMKDCLAGKIDLVIAKSICRMTSDLMDLEQNVSILKRHDPPIGIWFEAEGFASLDLEWVQVAMMKGGKGGTMKA